MIARSQNHSGFWRHYYEAKLGSCLVPLLFQEGDALLQTLCAVHDTVTSVARIANPASEAPVLWQWSRTEPRTTARSTHRGRHLVSAGSSFPAAGAGSRLGELRIYDGNRDAFCASIPCQDSRRSGPHRHVSSEELPELRFVAASLQLLEDLRKAFVAHARQRLRRQLEDPHTQFFRHMI